MVNTFYDYTTVTETPDTQAPKEQLDRLYTRYKFVQEYCRNKDVLEVACGSGQGLGLLASYARSVVGTDINANNLGYAQKRYQGNNKIRLQLLDAHDLTFADGQFDIVILYEAIYYLEAPDIFIKEASRVLRPGGMIFICTANKDWPEFNPSPYSRRYFSVPELAAFLKNWGFGNISMYASHETNRNYLKDKIIAFVKRIAVKLHLIPKTMKGKELFKRLFFGRLYPIPAEITEGMFEYNKPITISKDSPQPNYKVIYAVATKTNGR